MTLMLASVVDVSEAKMALQSGADVIDVIALNDTSAQSCDGLEALPPTIMTELVGTVAGKALVSALVGNVPMEPRNLAASITRLQAMGVDIIKVGIFFDERHASNLNAAKLDAAFLAALLPAAVRGRLLAVLAADSAPDLAILPRLREAGFYGAMLDTAHKSTGRLLDHRNFSELAAFVAACRAWDLASGLAGGLETPDIPRLLALKPNYLGFRGALGPRRDHTARLNIRALTLVRALIPHDEGDHAPKARAEPVPVHIDANAPTDTIFVRDLVLPMQIGAYAFEEGQTQDVRFSVDVAVARRQPDGDTMRGIFSYDLMIDAIKLIISRGHVAMVETLAEAIAKDLLAHDQVRHVKVRVEKLNVINGVVGIEIERGR